MTDSSCRSQQQKNSTTSDAAAAPTASSSSTQATSANGGGAGGGNNRMKDTKKKYTIHPPTTLGDHGQPSTSLFRDIQRVFAFIQDERHLTAELLLTSIRQRINATEFELENKNPSTPMSNNDCNSPASKQRDHHHHNPFGFGSNSKKQRQQQQDNSNERIIQQREFQKVKQILDEKKAVLETLENRCRIFRRAQQNLNETEDWTLASKHFGITTYYRREKDKSLSVKLQGEMKNAPLFEQICVLREVDLHYRWSPFCTASMTLAHLDKLDIVGWFMIGMPNFGLARDGCFRAIGCDNILEDGSILLAGQGIHDNNDNIPSTSSPPDDTFLSQDPVLDELDIPPVPTRRGNGRMTIRKFEAKMEVTSPTSVITKVVCNVNPNMYFMPKSLLEIIMKHLAGMVLAKLQIAAKRAVENPVTNDHAKKMRQERDFYRTWLVAKFKGICEAHGWDVPKVAAFHLTAKQKAHEMHLVGRSQSFTPGENNNNSEENDFEEEEEKQENASEDQKENVVENLSAIDQQPHRPPHRALTADNVSDLSLGSTKASSVWNNNPIATYMRDKELKAQQEKVAKIAAQRRVVAERLKPKEFPPHKQKRLDELKRTKATRLEQKQQDRGNVPQTASQRFSYKLYSNGPWIRSMSVVSLVLILFVMLHPEPLLDLIPRYFKDSKVPWLAFVAEDFAVVCYILLCAVPHFLVCDMALLYAFDALELGAQAGRQLKDFYSDNVRMVVAAGSLGIVGVGIAKAAAKVWLRASLWALVRAFIFAQTYSRMYISWLGSMVTFFDIHGFLPGAMQEVFDVSVSYVKLGLHWIVWKLGAAAAGLKTLLLETNAVGREVTHLIGFISQAYAGVAARADRFVVESLDAFEGRATIISWRVEAFNTARTLFAYTSVFLLLVLVFFNISARKEGSKKNAVFRSEVVHSASDNSTVETSSHEEIQAAATISTPYSSIPEDNEVTFDDKQAASARRPLDDNDSTPSAARRRRRFRLRRKKAESAPLKAVETDERMLEKSDTF